MENPAGKNILQDQLTTLESLLVKQFRSLQTLVNVTKKERTILVKGDAIALVSLVDEKKTLLDQLSVLEDSTHMVREEIARGVGVDPQTSSFLEILEQIPSPAAEKIRRLREGILTLYDECKDLNKGNAALAQTSVDWLGSTQQFLLDFYNAPESYNSLGRVPQSESIQFRDRSHKA